MRDTSLVIFDLDGVLLDSSGAWHRVMNDTARHLGLPSISAADFRATFGQGTDRDSPMFFGGTSSIEIEDLYHRFFQDHLDSLEPIPGAADLLDDLARLGIHRALATNTGRPLALDLVSRLGLEGRLELIRCSTDVPSAKPAPDMLVECLQHFDVPPTSAMFVGDAITDQQAAAAISMPFIGYRLDAGVRVENLAEILEVVASSEIT